MTASFRPARRIGDLGVSEILAITARAGALKREGRPIIILGTGEPDFDTPDHIKTAAIAAIRKGETKYTNLDGSPEMKRAIRDKFARENGLTFAQNEVTAGAGAKQMLYNAMMASLNDGDEVIIPTPCWTSYFDIVQIAGGVPVAVPCPGADGFRLTARALEAAITPRTKWLMLNSPSNPTGAAYGAEHYRPLLEVLRRHPHVWLMVDDIYEHIVYDDFRFVTPLALDPSLKDRCLTINGVSKAYAMTGWRLGYAGGPAALIAGMAVVQSQATSCPSSVTQAASIAALDGPQEFLRERRASFARRCDIVVDALNAIDGIHCRRPEGAFYTFASCEGMIGRVTPEGATLTSDRDFCAWLLDRADVAVVPGSAFGLSPYFRISYATSEAELTEALARITRACATLRGPDRIYSE
ncbi:pyridoxal phosphate-dependent aminotransferase [Falsirhodobacter halotolerans]|uniref:pyridoxal phosphate-dependent aminotransferase n=1 Tax=Falsirhodobacter halotolerans TaxID=1146892 RepID=UPI001FD2D1E8|nr:pyridoxal phosphate-dependent aminotransferase [Falsirhodobacter halotolerans]MCJ8141009.1 pyridoxal phosphate-dependent aminotransferase [Falsirhodobacter halotolerans]